MFLSAFSCVYLSASRLLLPAPRGGGGQPAVYRQVHVPAFQSRDPRGSAGSETAGIGSRHSSAPGHRRRPPPLPALQERAATVKLYGHLNQGEVDPPGQLETADQVKRPGQLQDQVQTRGALEIRVLSQF